MLQGQETEVAQPENLGELAKESAKEAGRAISELTESASLLLYKLGEAVGVFRHTFPVGQKENATPQMEPEQQRNGEATEVELNVSRAQHHGDLFRGKSLR